MRLIVKLTKTYEYEATIEVEGFEDDLEALNRTDADPQDFEKVAQACKAIAALTEDDFGIVGACTDMEVFSKDYEDLTGVIQPNNSNICL